MKTHCAILANVMLITFACLIVVSQLWSDPSKNKSEYIMVGPSSSIVQSAIRGNHLAHIADIVQRTGAISPGNGNARYLDLVLPKDAHIFMPRMTGPTNGGKLGYYFYMTYYLFPREVAVSLDRPQYIAQAIQGRSSDSDQEILSNGYDVRVDMGPDARTQVKVLHQIAIRNQTNPSWFDSPRDVYIAFLLPFLTALAGTRLLRILFSALSERLPICERLACGLGLGMMAVAALTLGVKLCGFHGYGLVFMFATVGAVAELWCARITYLNGLANSFWKTVKAPVRLGIFVAGLLVFLVLFRLAGLEDITDYDAVTMWMLKAKIIHLCAGKEIIAWFSNPSMACAHFDYPTLVPSLHAATYDSLGHVNEFVSKFWPTWMLLFLLMALASLSRGTLGRFHAAQFFLLGVLLLPITQTYVQMEGATLPMVFFTVMGLAQCSIGLVERHRARLGLGVTLLFGAAMTKFEGFIFLTVICGWILLLPSARPSLQPSPRLLPLIVFCFLAALPFICVRVQIPALYFEAGWAGWAAAHPVNTALTVPKIFLIVFARLFLNSDFAKWTATGDQLHWTGQWHGLSSFYNQQTLGLAWVGLLIAILLWLAAPARRPIIFWALAVFISVTLALSVVFASFVGNAGLEYAIEFTADSISGRYLFPILLAWAATMLVMFFGDSFPLISTPASDKELKHTQDTG